MKHSMYLPVPLHPESSVSQRLRRGHTHHGVALDWPAPARYLFSGQARNSGHGQGPPPMYPVVLLSGSGRLLLLGLSVVIAYRRQLLHGAALRKVLSGPFTVLVEFRCGAPDYHRAPRAGALVSQSGGLAVVRWWRAARPVWRAPELYAYFGATPPDPTRRKVMVVPLSESPSGVQFDCADHSRLRVVEREQLDRWAGEAKRNGKPLVRRVSPTRN